MLVKRLLHSFRDAGRGLRHVFRSEQNFRIQLVVAALAALAAAYFPLRRSETVVVILLIVLVLAMELLNTAVEYCVDLLKPRLHHYVLAIKDIMAAAVLLTSLGALLIGIIIFYPHFISLVK